MKYLKIKNDGLLDHRLIGLMGGTTKANDVYKIGEFGSGLKYTLAYLFRTNTDFRLFVGEKEINITIDEEIIRDEKFEIICIDGHRTSVTTKMGKKWVAWMIVRELWSNALDEGGAENSQTSELIGTPHTTTFYIQITAEIADVIESWNKYFIHDQQPMSETETYKIYIGGKSLKIYKQGILIHEDETKPGLFAYDIKNADINELREYQTWRKDWDLTKALNNADEKVVEYALEHMTEEHYEGNMDYAWGDCKFSDTWQKVIGNAKLIHQKALEALEAREVKIDKDKLVVVPKNLFIRLNAQFEGVGALRASDKINEFFEIHDADMELKIKSALATLETAGYFISPELKFLYGIFGDKTILAQVDFDKKEILVSELMREMPMFNFVAMIVEENEHFRTGHQDCSRAFQTHFIHLYVNTMLSKAEIKI